MLIALDLSMADPSYIVLYDISALGNILIVFLFFFPLFLNLRYYMRTKIKDYLLLSIYFLYWCFGVAIIIWAYEIQLFEFYWEGGTTTAPAWVGWVVYNIFILFWTPLDTLPLVIVALRAKYGNDIRDYSRTILVIIFIMVIFSLYSWFDQEQTQTTPGVIQTSLSFWAVWLTRLVFYLITAYCFFTSEFVETQKSKRSRYLWIWSSIFWAISFVLFSVGGLLAYPQDQSIFILDIAITSSYTIGATLTLYNHIAHPESVLITHEQIHIALRMYENIELHGDPIADFGVSRIKSYIDNLPNELQEELASAEA